MSTTFLLLGPHFDKQLTKSKMLFRKLTWFLSFRSGALVVRCLTGSWIRLRSLVSAGRLMRILGQVSG
jgi:hypothetical protein